MSVISLQKRVAKRIKELRVKRGLLQKDFEKFGYSERHYQKIESGTLNLTLKTLFKISQALNIEVADVLKKEDEQRWVEVYEGILLGCGFGIIVWRLPDFSNLDSLCLFEHNSFGAKAVYRDLMNSKGKSMLEIFPKAKEQGVHQTLCEVITTGKSQFVPVVIRHDEDFPLTVFSTHFVKCGPDLGAAVFIDITEDYLSRQELLRDKKQLEQLSHLPTGQNIEIADLREEVDRLLNELGRAPKYSKPGTPL